MTIRSARAFATTSTAINIHSHFIDTTSSGWTAYAFRGRMWISDTRGGIGVTFLSDYPVRDAYYRLRWSGNGSFLIAKHVSAVMKKQRAGTIILTASGAGVLGGSSSFAYGSSKGGVHGLAMVMDAQLSGYGIRVNDVLPGAVDTPLKVAQVKTMHDHSGDEKSYEAAIERLVSPDDVARIYAFVASDDANLLKGSVRTQ